MTTDQDRSYDWDDQADDHDWEDTQDEYDAAEAGTPYSGNGNGSPSGNGARSRSSRPRAEDILDAPPYASFVKITDTKISREYRIKSQSMLKAAALGAIRLGDLPDAAAILHYGPDFCVSVGHLAEASERARGAVDMLTAPDNPYVVFAMTALPLLSQLIRNNQGAIAEIPQRRRMWQSARKAQAQAEAAGEAAKPTLEFQVPFTKFKVRMRLRMKLRLAKVLGGFMRNSQDPQLLTHQVFSDDALLRALAKHGIRISRSDPDAE